MIKIFIILIFLIIFIIIIKNRNKDIKFKWQFKLSKDDPSIFFAKNYILASDSDYSYLLNALDGTLKWKYELGIISSVKVFEEVIYIFSVEEVVAINLEDGIVKWRYPLSGFLHRNGYIDDNVFFINNLIYLITEKGEFFLLNSKSGKKIASFKTLNLYDNSIFYAVQGYILITTKDKNLNCIDIQSGKILWSKKVEIDKYNAYFKVVDKVIYIRTDKREVSSIDIETGVVIWKFNFEKEITFLDVKEDIILVYSQFYLYALKLKTGELIWKTKVSDKIDDLFNCIAIKEDAIFVNTDFLSSINLYDGTFNWKNDKLYVCCKPIKIMDNLLFLADYYNAYAVNIYNGNANWVKYLQGKVLSIENIYVNKDIFIVIYEKDYNYYIYFLHPLKGKLLGKIKLRSIYKGYLYVPENKHLYLLTKDGYLYAIDKESFI